MPRLADHDFDDEDDDREEVWEEVGYVEEASKRLIRRHEAEYRKLVEEIDIDRLHREIDRWKGEVAKRDRDIRRLKLKNPDSTHVPALIASMAALQAENERLEAAAVAAKKRKTRPRAKTLK